MSLSWRRHVTAATTGIFAVVGVSGVMMFFHVGEAQVKSMHEWLGLAFVAVTAFHVWRNWPSFASMLGRRGTHVLFVIALLAAGGFVGASLGGGGGPRGGGNPMRQILMAAENAPLTNLAPLLGVSDQVLMRRLTQAGVPVADPSLSLRQIASRGGVEMPKLFAAVTTREK